MRIVETKEEILSEVKDKTMTMLYFGSDTCGVCVDLKPKVIALLKDKYPNIEPMYVDVQKSLKISAEYDVFTIPVIIVFADGKEVIREARHISVMELDEKINRYYNMLF